MINEVTLYKYYSPSEIDRSLVQILNQTIFLPSPFKVFNDPFDSMIRYTSKINKDVFELLIDYILKKIEISGARETISEAYLSCFAQKCQNGYPYFSDLLSYYLEDSRDDPMELFKYFKSNIQNSDLNRFFSHYLSVGISCFSLVKDDPKMWAHYSSNHTGFCIEFSFPKENLDLGLGFYQVIYENHLASVIECNESGASYSEIIKQLSLKSNHWSHEKEVRLISMSKADSLITLPGEIKGVCLGLKCKKNDIDRIYRQVKSKNKLIKIYNASKSTEEFKIDWFDINA